MWHEAFLEAKVIGGGPCVTRSMKMRGNIHVLILLYYRVLKHQTLIFLEIPVENRIRSKVLLFYRVAHANLNIYSMYYEC